MQLDPWPPCLDVGLDRKEGSGDAGIEKRWWIIQRKKVRPKTSGTSYETVAVLPLAGLCCGSCGGRKERSLPKVLLRLNVRGLKSRKSSTRQNNSLHQFSSY